jgi:hypothetical protein
LVQQAAQVVPQHNRPLPAHTVFEFLQVCVVTSQVSTVQSLLSAHCVSFVHWMQPPLAGSQVGAAALH